MSCFLSRTTKFPLYIVDNTRKNPQLAYEVPFTISNPSKMGHHEKVGDFALTIPKVADIIKYKDIVSARNIGDMASLMLCMYESELGY